MINGQKVYEGPIDEDDVVFVELEHNIKEYSSLQERIELRGDYPYFEDYIGGHGLNEVLESDQLYNEWFSLQPKHIKKELELGIYRVRAYPESNDKIGCSIIDGERKQNQGRQRQYPHRGMGRGSVYQGSPSIPATRWTSCSSTSSGMAISIYTYSIELEITLFCHISG